MLLAQISHSPALAGRFIKQRGLWAGAWAACGAIQTKLIFAFALITSLTVLASSTAFLSNRSLGEKLRQIETQSLPRFSELFLLSRQASALSALSASIAVANNSDELEKAKGVVKNLWASMSANLTVYAELAENSVTAEGLRSLTDDLVTSSSLLADSVANRLHVRSERQTLVERSSIAQRELSEKLAPILDDASFNLAMGLRLSAQIR